MTDTTTPALLGELREVDADTYREIQKRLLHYMIAPQMDAPIVLDHIQGCIQRAIAARGWEYQVAYNPHIGPDGRHGQAYIWPLSEVTKCYESEEDTPAAAILAAYIEAVRARQ